jgi:hypothetical protein
MQLNHEQLEFLARFAKTPDGQMLMAIYRARLAEVDGKLRTAEGAEMHRQQGRAQQLDELLTGITEARSKLARNAVPTPQRSAFAGA